MIPSVMILCDIFIIKYSVVNEMGLLVFSDTISGLNSDYRYSRQLAHLFLRTTIDELVAERASQSASEASSSQSVSESLDSICFR
jgi:hypothetical protein